MSLAVTICIPVELRNFTDNQETIEVNAQTVGEAMQALFDTYPSLEGRVIDSQGQLFPYLVLTHNRDRLDWKSTQLRQLAYGDELDIFALASGG